MRVLKTSTSLKLVLCAAFALSACSSGAGNGGEGSSGGGIFSGGVVEKNPRSRRARAGTFDDQSVLDGQSIRQTLLGQGIDDNRLPVNKYLWRASLDVLDFLPLASVDTFSGVIATDWGAAPGASNERVRATVYVRDAELTATALDVSVFREMLSPGGVWQSATVSPQTADQLENAILTRARQLRIEDVDG